MADRPMEQRGTVNYVMVGFDQNSLVTAMVGEVQVTLEGFEDDKHAGLTRIAGARDPKKKRGEKIRNNRQVTIVSIEELGLIAGELDVPAIWPEWLGANLALSGIPNLTMLPKGTRLFFPADTVLLVESENKPCIHPGKIIQEQDPDKPGLATLFPKAAMHKRGLVATVERAGAIRQYDEVRVVLP